MLYGTLIFIKKTGGDGSKFPVTEKNIKIGRSEKCLIRIYTPQVAPEHCQLIIDCKGQAKLRNLFTPTILNGKPLGQGDVTLCHGDVFKLGERLARWEYLPTSKYFKQLLSPKGCLVAVVKPQRRSTEISGTSSTQASGSKNTSLESKRKFSEKFSSENSSMAKRRKTVGSDESMKPEIDLGKPLIGRHSIKIGKSILKTPVLNQRKSVSGIINSKTPRNKAENHRKSIFSSWKVSVDAEPTQSTQNKKSPSKWPDKTPSKQSLKNEVRTPSKSTPIKMKTPKRLKLEPKSGEKTILNTILESPPKLESVRLARSFSNSPPAKVISTPKRKSPVQAVRLVQSEKKSKATPRLKGFRKMSFRKMFKKVNRSERKSKNEKKMVSVENESQVQVSSSEASNSSGGRKSSRKSGVSFNSSKNTSRKSVKSTTEKTPRNVNKPSNQNSVKQAAIVIAQTPPLIDLSYEGDSVNTKQTFRESVISSRKRCKKSVRKSSVRSVDILQTPQKFSKNAATPSLENTKEQSSRSTVPSPVSTAFGSRKPRNVSLSKKENSSIKKFKASPRGVRRQLSPSISSAERAAKKLKTSSPKKPDKNKRAALLVLGKANRKQLLSHNVKVLLKQKIVKKAIKQSVALPIRKNGKKKTSVKKIRKESQKEKKKSAKTPSPSRISQLVKESPDSSKLNKSINESENDNPNVKKSLERSSLSRSKVSSPLSPAKVATLNIEIAKSVTKSSKKVESILSPKSTNETISPLIKFDKSSESYIFSSSHRCSKRLSSKNDTERPDFVELSPTALGLIPKNIEMFKTPKEKKRKSSSLVTPRNIAAAGIIKSASTSKIGNRKSVSFSSKDFSLGTTACTPTMNEKTDFDFDSFHTSNITMDVFVSPLNKSSATPVMEFVTDENVEPSEKRGTPGVKKVTRKLLQSPQNDRASKSSKFSDQTNTPSVSESGVQKPVDSSRGRNSPKNDLNDVRSVKKLFDTPKAQRSPKNDLSDLKGVKRLMQTPRVQKSPKNDLSDLRGVKKLVQTPRIQKSPKNDLSDVRGVKKLLRTPKIQMSPKNDLSDLRGVKKLMQTPRVRKSPKNDLSDVRGVKKLMRTPKIQKSPKNDLSDLRGVKKLMQTPRIQKSPKNDLSNIRGVKKLMRTPRVQKSPKNDLSDVKGVKKLMQTPKMQKSPKNDLSDVRGVKKLMRTPKKQKSPKNELSDLRGVKKLMGTPKAQKSPKNDLSDLRGIKKLMQTPRKQKSPKNELSDLVGVKNLFQSPRNQKSPKNDLRDVTGVRELMRSPNAQKSPQNNLSDVEGVKELFASPPSGASRKMRTPDGRKLRKLPGGHKRLSKRDLSSVGTAKLLEEKVSAGVRETKTNGRGKRNVEEEKEQKKSTPKTRARKGFAKVKTVRVTRSAKKDTAEKEVSKREAVGGRQKTKSKTSEAVKKSTRRRGEETPKGEASKTLRKRKTVEPAEATPPKVRRKAAATAKQSTSKEPKRVAVKSTARTDDAKSSKKTPGKAKTPVKKASAGQSKATKSVKSVSKTQKVQRGRSQTVFKEKSLTSKSISPRKTRAAAAKS